MSVQLEALRINRRNARAIEVMRYQVLRDIREGFMLARANLLDVDLHAARLLPDMCCKRLYTRDGETFCCEPRGHSGEHVADEIPF